MSNLSLYSVTFLCSFIFASFSDRILFCRLTLWWGEMDLTGSPDSSMQTNGLTIISILKSFLQPEIKDSFVQGILALGFIISCSYIYVSLFLQNPPSSQKYQKTQLDSKKTGYTILGESKTRHKRSSRSLKRANYI